jgi:hypothetical protein
MKQTLLIGLLALLAYAPAQSQTSSRGDQKLVRRMAPAAAGCPRVYIGFSTGINNPVGLLGPQVDLASTDRVSIGSGIGLSSWGYKTYLEGRYYFKPCNRGWALAGGLTYNTGETEVTLQTEETIVGEAQVTIRQEGQANFMLSAYHFFNLGRQGRNRFHLQFGYSVPLSASRFSQTAGPALTSRGADIIEAIAPGGLLLGVGFSFGAGRQ